MHENVALWRWDNPVGVAVRPSGKLPPRVNVRAPADPRARATRLRGRHPRPPVRIVALCGLVLGPSMAGAEERIKIVLVSPGDVPKERVLAKGVIDELNRGVAADRLTLWQWETHARSGMSKDGSQHGIDDAMDIETADVVVGVFWRRFGTPTSEADSGTEHELRRAWAAWEASGRPDVMVYFCTRKYAPREPAELEQWQRVLEFKREMPGEQLWWEYRTPLEFERALREHLTRYLLARGDIAGTSSDEARHRGEPARQGTSGRQPCEYSGRPLEFDGVDVGLQVVVGTLGVAFGREDVRATLTDQRWTAPPELREYARLYALERGYYDGQVARLNRVDIGTYADHRGSERHRLRLEMAPTGFFDMLATNVALGPFTHDEAPLLAGRSGVPETELSNMVGLDLTLITRDGHVPVFLRAAGMAALERCWQTSSGETLQLPIDLDTDGQPDVFKTALRGLHEELGLTPELIADIAVTALVATPEYANIGVLMRAIIECSGEQLHARINRYVMTARDNWEYTSHSTLAIDDVRELAHALTDPTRQWTKQAVASLVFAHAERANGNVVPLAEAINAAGELNLDAGPAVRDILPPDWRSALKPRS